MEELNNYENNKGSPIQEFYRNKSVFITGATGFIGKALVEKLLYSCPHIANIYLLIRTKKNKDCNQRLSEFLENPVFQRLNEKNRTKLIGIAGDMTLPELGISEDNQKILIENVNVVFHVAATVRFDESLIDAVKLNVGGTKESLNLSKKMKHLKAHIHVSTAFSNCLLRKVDEKLYDPPTSAERLFKLIENIDPSLLDQITPVVLGDWPNTYVYTKSIAEDLVKTQSKGLPVSIYRPAIVIAADKEPMPGWVDNFNGATGILVGVGTGFLRSFPCDRSKIADLVPVDMCVNSLIGVSWKTANRYIEEQDINSRNLKNEEEIPIYNYVSSVENPIRWNQVMDLSMKFGKQTPSVQSIWCYYITLTKYLFIHQILNLFFHILPGIVIDCISYIIGKPPQMLKLYKKINKMISVVSYFTLTDRHFTNSNVQRLWKSLNPADQALFPFDLSTFNWDIYFKSYVTGIRKYLLKEDEASIPYAKVRLQRFTVIHNCIKFFLYFLLLRIIWSVLILFF